MANIAKANLEDLVKAFRKAAEPKEKKKTRMTNPALA